MIRNGRLLGRECAVRLRDEGLRQMAEQCSRQMRCSSSAQYVARCGAQADGGAWQTDGSLTALWQVQARSLVLWRCYGVKRRYSPLDRRYNITLLGSQTNLLSLLYNDSYSADEQATTAVGVSSRYPSFVVSVPAFPVLFEYSELADLVLMFLLLVVSVD